MTFWGPKIPSHEVLYDVFQCFNLFHRHLQSDERGQSVFILEQGDSILE